MLLIFKNNFVVFSGLLLLAFLLFGNGLEGDFVLDDRSVISGSPLVENWTGVFEAWLNPYHYARPQSGLYRPLTLVSFNLDWHLFSGRPLGFHLINILLHALASFFIFLTVLNLRDRLTAGISAGLFLFLPIHVEAVTSIVGRGELLAFLFFLAAFCAVQKKRYLLAAISFFLSLFSKETALAFLPIWLFYEAVWKKTPPRMIVSRGLYFLFPLTIYLGLRYFVLGGEYFLSADPYSFFNPLIELDFWPGLWTAFKVLFLYVQKIIFPPYFSSDYSYNQIPVVRHLFDSGRAGAGILIFGLTVFLTVAKRHRLIGLGAAIFLCSYLLISNLMVKTGTIMAERLMYFPSFGFALIVSEIFSVLIKKNQRMAKGLGVGLVLLAAVYGVQILKGNALWKNEKTLFENAYQQAPHSVVNITNLASLLFREGRNEEALAKVETALKIESQNSPALHLLGQIYQKMGKEDQAEETWQKAIAIQPDYLYPYLSLGAFYYQKENFQAGEAVLLRAKKRYDTLNVITLLALNQLGQGRSAEAISLIESKFGLKPKAFELRFALGVAYLQSGNEQKARILLLDLKDPALTEKDFLENLKTTKIFPVEI